jgi:hypothetical protein
MGYQTANLQTLKVNLFNTIATFVNANKSSGWTVLSAFPESSPKFPCIVVSSAVVQTNVKGQNRKLRMPSAIVTLEFFCPANSSYGKASIDAEVDKIKWALLEGYTTLRQYNVHIDTNVGIGDLGEDQIIFNDRKLYYDGLEIPIKI